jgi:hypothetical protein
VLKVFSKGEERGLVMGDRGRYRRQCAAIY